MRLQAAQGRKQEHDSELLLQKCPTRRRSLPLALTHSLL